MHIDDEELNKDGTPTDKPDVGCPDWMQDLGYDPSDNDISTKELLNRVKGAFKRRSNGRPRVYEPWMCDAVLIMGRKGFSKPKIAAELNVAKMTIHNWANPEHASYEPEFAEAMELAMTYSEAYWTDDLGAANLMDNSHLGAPKLNTPMYKLQMGARFGWGDKMELSGGQEVKITIDQEDADL